MLKGDEAALIMAAVAGCSLAEIAVAAEVSVSTVQRRLRDDDIRAGRTRRAHAAASRGGRSPQRGRAAGDRSTRSVRRRRQPADRLERDRHASGQRPQACGRRLRGTAQRSRAEATARKPAMRKWDARLESIESKRAGGRTAVWEGDGTWQQSAYSVQLAAKLGLRRSEYDDLQRGCSRNTYRPPIIWRSRPWSTTRQRRPPTNRQRIASRCGSHTPRLRTCSGGEPETNLNSVRSGQR